MQKIRAVTSEEVEVEKLGSRIGNPFRRKELTVPPATTSIAQASKSEMHSQKSIQHEPPVQHKGSIDYAQYLKSVLKTSKTEADTKIDALQDEIRCLQDHLQAEFRSLHKDIDTMKTKIHSTKQQLGISS